METTEIARKELVTHRDYNPLSDEGFIMSTWLKGLRYGNELFRQIEDKAYYENYKRVIETLLKRPLIKIKIACFKDNSDVILGYAVNECHICHWVFVKLAWRRIGIARELIPSSIKAVTHMTHSSKIIMKDKLPNVIFNPFL